MIIRELEISEWPLLEPIFKDEGGNLPLPTTANVFGAFDDQGELAGFWVFQLVYHAGPLWIRPDHRGTRLWEKIHSSIVGWLQQFKTPGFYSFSNCDKVEHIFKELGYENLGYKVWKKEIK